MNTPDKVWVLAFFSVQAVSISQLTSTIDLIQCDLDSSTEKLSHYVGSVAHRCHSYHICGFPIVGPFLKLLTEFEMLPDFLRIKPFPPTFPHPRLYQYQKGEHSELIRTM